MGALVAYLRERESTWMRHMSINRTQRTRVRLHRHVLRKFVILRMGVRSEGSFGDSQDPIGR